ncbi:BON domain-containing protein [Legionella sp. CNM-4043-24]|uniref:BON domain-containing protein n=1 Tax=Legionella sp. CNM-4043-24 TaxID=3421646 RepID=UPI00403AA8FA
MKNVYRTLFIAASAMVLVACHTVSGSELPWSAIGHSDTSLTDSVSAAMMANPQLAGLPIQVQSEKGTVRLSGYVKTIRQSDVAGDVASRVDGVKMVENNLIVRK